MRPLLFFFFILNAKSPVSEHWRDLLSCLPRACWRGHGAMAPLVASPPQQVQLCERETALLQVKGFGQERGMKDPSFQIRLDGV